MGHDQHRLPQLQQQVAAALGARGAAVSNGDLADAASVPPAALRGNLVVALATPGPGTSVVEVRVDRSRRRALQEQIAAGVRDAVR